MPASFLASLLVLAAAPNLTSIPATVSSADSSLLPQLNLLPVAATYSSAAATTASSHHLSASILVLDPGSRLTAVRQQDAILPPSEDSLQEFFASDRRPISIAAGSTTGVGGGVLGHNTANFGFSAQWQSAARTKLQIRLGQDRPLRLDFVETPRRTETTLSWQALPSLSLMGKSRDDGWAAFGGKVAFGEERRHSFSLMREEPGTRTSGATDARLALGGSLPTKVHYRFRDRGSDRWQISQDLGALRWDVRRQSGHLRIYTSLAFKRSTNGRRRASFDVEHAVQTRTLEDIRTLTTASLNSNLWGWQGALGVAWNEQGQTGPVASAQVPLLGPKLSIKGSYRGLAINGRRQDYRVELRSRFRF